MASQHARALYEAEAMSARVDGAGDRDRGERRKGRVVAHWALQVCESELGEGSGRSDDEVGVGSATEMRSRRRGLRAVVV